MKTYDSVKTFTIALLITVAAALPSLAEDAGVKSTNSTPDDAQMMAAMLAVGKPGENHKVLAVLAGSWTYTTKFWFNPDTNAAPSEFSGTSAAKPIMDGRYFQTDVTGKMQMPGADGKMMDMDFKGMEIAGYDNAEKKFVSSWVDNTGTGIMRSEGDYDPATKTITYKAEYEALPGMKTKMRELLKLTDQDHHTLEFYEDRGGVEVKTMEIAYTRKK